MRTSNLSRLLAALLLVLGVALAPAAQAQEPPEDGGLPQEVPLFERLDKAFGDYMVTPLATVMFYDLVFWDDTWPIGEGVGHVLDGEEVVRYGEEGYVLAKRLEAPVAELTPRLDEPVTRRLGQLEVEITTEQGQLVGRVPAQEVDVEALGLVPEEPGIEGPPVEEVPEPVTVDTLAPFPVQVDVAAGRTVETTVELPADTLEIVAGMPVLFEGTMASVVAVEDGVATLRSAAERTVAGPLERPDDTQLPFIVAWLVAGATFFTLRMGFINVRAFPHALKVVTGAYDDPDEPGEISHFQALASALSATVGLGNIAGVAIAIGAGGPGAVIWMVVAALLGMSSKFTECSLGQMYRTVKPYGSVSGGPMHYLDEGLAEIGLGPIGKAAGVLFALMCIGGSFGGGNMFQANQSYAAISDIFPALPNWLYGIVLAVFVGVVIIGGIRRIGTATSVIVPVMCAIYILAGLYILVVNAAQVPGAFGTMLHEAFTLEAGFGGLLGVIVTGFQRASFSNEAGVGSASIAHSAASTDEPIREGIVALLEPFIDTVLVCTMTGLVVTVTGVYQRKDIADGVVMTSEAFATVLPWFPSLLAVAVVLFAFSTMISWSYYGERCTTWLVGDWAVLPYRSIFLVFVFCGAVFDLGTVLDFSDLMVLGMAFPNIFGAVLLSGKVKARLDQYLAKLRAGEFDAA